MSYRWEWGHPKSLAYFAIHDICFPSLHQVLYYSWLSCFSSLHQATRLPFKQLSKVSCSRKQWQHQSDYTGNQTYTYTYAHARMHTHACAHTHTHTYTHNLHAKVKICTHFTEVVMLFLTSYPIDK